ncbi:MAG: HAD family acid phosphatase [Candidatus Parabeggiatoa sp.]|nr:HAD family acid phosphatase [Candidatus Parabeggiatoa sp.]
MGYKALFNQWADGDYATPTMIPHGLWFNFFKYRVFPNQCASNKTFKLDDFPQFLQDQMRNLYPQLTYGLAQHEWKKHGVCSGWSAQTYFARIIELHEKLPVPQIITDNIGKSVSYQALLDAYGGDKSQTFLSCHHVKFDYRKTEHRQYLSQIATSWKLDDGKLVQINQMSTYGGLSGCDEDKEIYIRKPGKFISLNKLKDDLPNSPIPVGFDIDDTLLFSEPGFSYVRNHLHLNPKTKAFWEHINTLDQYSLVTEVGSALIKLHKQRGDDIYIITARPETKNATLIDVLANVFDIPLDSQHFIFTNHCKIGCSGPCCENSNDKTSYIKDKKLDLYYGDADADVVSAQRANTQAIRVQRAANSVNKSGYHPGGFGEKVLFNPVP